MNKKERFFKVFRNAHDPYPDTYFLFHDLNYNGDEIKKSAFELCKNLNRDNVDNIVIYVNRPRFLELNEESMKLTNEFVNTFKRFMYTYSSIYNIEVKYLKKF